MTEQFANDAATTLSAAIETTDGTSISVTSAAGFPSSAQYRIIIDDEIMIVTAGAGTTTWTVTRAAESTTGATHANGAAVTHVLTAGGLDGLTENNVATAAYASRPAAAKAGRLFLPSDGYTLDRDTGAAWLSWGPLFALTTPPAVASWTWVNQGAATATDTKNGVLLAIPATGGADNLNVAMLVASSPATPYTVTALMLPLTLRTNSAVNNFGMYGIVFRQSSDGKLVCFKMQQNSYASANDGYWRVTKNASPTAETASYLDFYPLPRMPHPVWLRIADDGTNRVTSMSVDGQGWIQLHSVGRTDYLTADQIGVMINAGGAWGVSALLLSWAVT